MVQRGGLVIIVVAGTIAGAAMLALLALLWTGFPHPRHVDHHAVPKPFVTAISRYDLKPMPFITPAQCRTFRLAGPPRKSHGGYVKTRMICPGQAADVHPPVAPSAMPKASLVPANGVHMPTPES